MGISQFHLIFRYLVLTSEIILAGTPQQKLLQVRRTEGSGSCCGSEAGESTLQSMARKKPLENHHV